MGKIYKASTKHYTEDMSIMEFLGHYRDYTADLSDGQLKREYKTNEANFLSDPTFKNVGMFRISKQRMLERGLPISKSFVSENSVEMQNF